MGKKFDLTGNLDFLDIADLLQVLGTVGSTGLLRIHNTYTQERAEVYFIRGNPVNASNRLQSGLDALYPLFGWTEGEFQFKREPVQCEQVIRQNRMELTLNALKMLDDGEIKRSGHGGAKKQSSGQPMSTQDTPLIKGPMVDYWYVVDEETYHDGEKIVEEGRHGNWIWVILEGVVDIVKDTPQGNVTLLRIGSGSFVGSISSFLSPNNVRSASTVAVGGVQLGVLDSQRLTNEVSSMSSEFKEFLKSLDRRLRQITGSAVEIYEKMGKLDEYIKDRTPVLKQGEDKQKLYLITQGEAFVVQNTDSGPILVSNLYQGDFFGLVPFLNMGHEPYAASVFGSKNLELIEVDIEGLQKEYDKLSTTFKNFIENVAACISVTTMVACNFLKRIEK